jgi:broad specificity phosphatase PhoE
VLTHAQRWRRAASVCTSTTSPAPLDTSEATQQQSLFSKLPQFFPPPSLRRAISVPGFAAFSGSSSERLPPTFPKTTHHVRNRTARSKYNASIMPHQIIMVRHGQSIGNVDEKLYATTPDNAMPLTRLGWEQAHHAGRKVWELTQGTSVHFIMSPYVRTVETFHGMASAWCDPSEFAHIADPDRRLKAWYGRLLERGLTWNEDPRIREQDFGNYQEPDKIKQAKRDRNRFGAFYYRFPHGESASDVRCCSLCVLFLHGLWLKLIYMWQVFDRVSTFLDSLWRSFDTNPARTYVLVTHGISIRVILARYFRYTISQFNLLINPVSHLSIASIRALIATVT